MTTTPQDISWYACCTLLVILLLVTWLCYSLIGLVLLIAPHGHSTAQTAVAAEQSGGLLACLLTRKTATNHLRAANSTEDCWQLYSTAYFHAYSCNKLCAWRHDMPPPLSSPMGAVAPRGARRRADRRACRRQRSSSFSRSIRSNADRKRRGE